MPVDANNMTKGFAFIEFNSPQEAAAARDHTHGYKLDKSHTFSVNMFDDFDKYDKVPAEYTAPETKEYQPTVNPLPHPPVPILTFLQTRCAGARKLPRMLTPRSVLACRRTCKSG